MKLKQSLVLAAAVAAAVAAPGAFATNGYLGHGIGEAAKGMGGAGIAVAQDGMATATNPANQMAVGSKLTFGMDWFRPFRSATLVDNSSGAFRDSQSNDFFIPEFGYATTVGSSSSLGIVVYGAGLGVDYSAPWNVVNNATGTTGGTNLYMLLKQMTIAPTWATKVGSNSFGISLNLVKENLDVRGLQGFDNGNQSRYAGSVTDKGEDGASGTGWKLGWVGEITSNFSLGATWQPKTSMSKFGRYKGLLAEQGKMDVPEQYGLGLSFKATPATVVGFDVAKIKWGGVKSFANTTPASAPTGLVAAGAALGDDGGAGFGWQDQTVYKLGVSHQLGKWTLRAGYNYGKTPVQASQTLFNTLAPAVTEKHYTLGATWTMNSTTDLGLAYMYSPNNQLNGTGTTVGLTNPNLKMNQNSLGISLNVKL